MNLSQLLTLLSLLGTVHSLLDPKCQKYYSTEIAELQEKIKKAKVLNNMFPNCLDTYNPNLAAFFNFLTASAPTRSFKDAGFDFTVGRINVPDPSVYNLRNWAHITIARRDGKSAAISFMILQAISSPLGLPFGEFRLDVRCQNEPAGVPPLDNERFVLCKYRPKSSLRHPGAYVVNMKLSGSKLYTDVVHVNFNWIDVMCHEVTAMQFNALVVHYDETSGSLSKAQYLSPVYYLTKQDKKIGIPYPWHPLWKDNTYCHAEKVYCPSLQGGPSGIGCYRGTSVTFEPLPLEEAQGNWRIIYNEEFHKCTQENKGLDLSNLVECPPGPFYCSRTRAEASVDNQALINQNPQTAQDNYPDLALEASSESYRLAMSKAWAACPDTLDGGDAYCPGYYTRILEDWCLVLFTNYPGRSREGRYEGVGRSGIGDGSLVSEYAVGYLRDKTVDRRAIDRSEHGALMIGAFFMIISGGNFLARYFKESGGESEETKNGCCGLGCWLLGHIGFSTVGIFMIWMSMAQPMDTLHCQKYDYANTSEEINVANRTRVYVIKYCVENPTNAVLVHRYLGYLVIFFVHVVFVLGWVRPLKQKMRQVLTAVHAIAGHTLHVTVIGMIAFTKVCSVVVYFLVCLLLLSLLLNGLATYLQQKKDKAVKLEPKRRHFPILEHDKDGDCTIGFVLQIWLYWIAHFIFYMLILFCYKVLILDGHCW